MEVEGRVVKFNAGRGLAIVRVTFTIEIPAKEFQNREAVAGNSRSSLRRLPLGTKIKAKLLLADESWPHLVEAVIIPDSP